MSNRQKYSKSRPDGEDIRKALEAFEKDLGLKSRLSWFNGDEDELVVVVEVYRELNGVRIGICKKRSVWREGNIDIVQRCLQTIYYAYHEAEALNMGNRVDDNGST